MLSRDQLDIRQHAAQRMLERGISVAEVLVALNSGVTIEDYPEDTPFPSRLTLGWVGERPVHVVWATAATTGRTVIITVYEPNPEESLPANIGETLCPPEISVQGGEMKY